jgi:hypothetical protein
MTGPPINEVGPRDTTPEGTDTNQTSADQSTDTHSIGDLADKWANIAGDIMCSQCGRMVIICPHINCFTVTRAAPTPRADIESKTFVQRVRERQAREKRSPKSPGTSAPASMAVTAPPGGNPAYVKAAIGKELATLAATREGSHKRNDTLNTVAFNVFGFVKGGHADKTACWDELKRIGAAIGLPDLEMVGFDGAHGTLGSAWQGATERQVPASYASYSPTTFAVGL